MAKGFKAVQTVCVAQAGIADAAEWQVAVQKVNHGVVDTGPARLGLGQHLLYRGLVLAVQVQGQRLGPLVDLRDDFVDVGKGDDGQQRPENLFFQNACPGADVVEQSGLHIALRLVHRTTGQHPGAVRFGVV